MVSPSTAQTTPDRVRRGTASEGWLSGELVLSVREECPLPQEIEGLVRGQDEACQVCTCAPTKKVDCKGKGLESVPLGIPRNTAQLDLGYNSLTRIERSTFVNLTKLLILDLGYNSLTRIERSSFVNLNKLWILKLRSNKISTIESGGFIGLSSFLNLQLDNNDLEKFDADILYDIGGGLLCEIQLSSNKLKSLSPLTFSGLATPSIIAVSNNSIEKIPPRLIYQRNKELILHIMDFSSNRIQSVATDAFEGVKYISELYLSSNSIAYLPETVFINTTIGRTLDLSSNLLKTIPRGLRYLRRLRNLYILSNSLSVLSMEMFDGMQSLEELIISGNPITKLDDRVFSDTQLVNLYIYNTHLRSIDGRPFVTRNNSIIFVAMYGNSIESISDSVWQDMGMNCRVFVGPTLRRAPHTRSDLEIGFAGSGFVQSVTVSKATSKALGYSGFSCSKLTHFKRNCTPCLQGTYGGPFRTCRACSPGGFFQNRTGQFIKTEVGMNCLSCNNGTYVTPETHPGRNIGDCVVCPSGTDKSRHAGFRACPCVSNYYRRDRFGECFPCPLEGVNCSGEYQHLLPGFWWTWDWNSTDNFQSYNNFVKNILMENDYYNRFTRKFHGVLPKAHPCPRNKSCLNLGVGINATCQHGYEDFLCSQCITGYYSWLGQCFKCPRWWVFLLEVLASIIVIIVVVLVVAWDLRRHRQRGRSVVSVLFSRFKILLGFYQILGEIFDALHDLPWPRSLIKFGSFCKVLEVNIMQLIVSPRCYFPNFTYPTIYLEFIAGLSFSVLVIMLALSAYNLKRFYLHLKETPRDVCNDVLTKMKQNCYLAVVILLFITYPSLSSAILALLPSGCDEFYLDEAEKVKVLLLRSNYSIDCETDQHLMYNYAAEASLCYIVGFPSVLLITLWMSRRRRMKNESDPSYMLGSINYLDQMSLFVADNTADQDAGAQVNEIPPDDFSGMGSPDDTHSLNDAATSNNQPLLIPSITSPAGSITWETFLCENYKEKFWYWEIVELARKIFQVLFVLLFGAEDHFTLFATIVLSVGFLVIHAYVKPMKHAAEHRLQMCSLASICLNLLTASLLLLPNEGAFTSETRKEVLAVFLVLLNLTLVAFVAGSAIWTFLKMIFKTACCRRAVLSTTHVYRLLRPPQQYSTQRRCPSLDTNGERQALLSD
ncbi:uncharacterized protein LOC110975569 [Acanthaster planci]|uniref:Uncharacterized protein LOC110975569 n=1 Tax=Acanthaster planci TaxID=133434 RepID=A0A8B7XSK3_ACAPL|nr:uncharacterized protein LOC110975569 [Acanthaster planci]